MKPNLSNISDIEKYNGNEKLESMGRKDNQEKVNRDMLA